MCAAAIALAAPARAHPYDAFVAAHDEDDLEDLAARGAIDDDTREALAELLARGVELDSADRDGLYSLPNLGWAEVDAILAYRAAHGGIRDPRELVGAGVITRAELDAIAAFLVVRGPGARGAIEVQARAAQDDRAPPATMVRARLFAGEHVTLGLGAIMTRLRIGDAAWDPDRGALVAAPAALGVEVPKLYARWQDDRAVAIVGSFRAGFGERLVFDDSLAAAPNGVYPDDRIARGGALVRGCDETTGELAASPCAGDTTYVTPDFTARDGLFGVAAGARAIPLAGGTLQAYGFVSYHRRSIYQYELYDAARCADPRATSSACAAPPLFVRDPDTPGPAAGLAYQTVPDVFREALAGGNATWFADRRTWLGVTGYGAETLGLLGGADLGYQEWADRPGATGDRFGAFGADAGFGRAWLDAGAEVARSVDAMRPAPGRIVHGGGGDAAIVRATATGARDVVELVLRWYGVDFVDPYARPVAERDALEGERARDEAGARARWIARRGAVALHTELDVWTLPAEGVTRTNDLVRVDAGGRARVTWGAWIRYEDRALGAPGRGACFDSTPSGGAIDPLTSAAAPVLCRGKRISAAARATWRAADALELTAQLTDRVQDDPRHPTGLRDDVAAWAIADWRPRPHVRVHGRARFLWQDVATPAYLEESLWTTADVTLGLRERDSLRVRADVYAWLDGRASTLARAPNPELWLWLEYALAF